ncbi:MAG TPA: phosphatase PAP2 family protein [Nitrospirae bacterium]|nr:phosphatase PAP2 family protein [Nitrospirota bacterium]
MDEIVFQFFNNTLANPYLDIIFVFLTSKGYLIFLPFIIYLYFLMRDKRAFFASMVVFTIAICLNDWISTEIKGIFERLRPCLVHQFRDVIGCSSSYSMPSNHSSNAFTASTILFFLSKRARLFIKAMVFTVAFLIGLSRVYLGVHYPTDVIAGALIGILVATASIYGFNKLTHHFRQRPFETVLFFSTIAFSLFRIYYIRHGGLDLSPDEAHYWEWSRRPDWSYYSKGPLVAWLIGLSTYLLGNTVLAIRILSVIFHALSSLLLYNLTKQIARLTLKNGHPDDAKRCGLIAFFSLQIVPLFSVYGIVFTIDTLLLFFWTASLFAFYKATYNNGDYRYWFLLGLLIGFGLLAKYTMVFFIVCAFIYLLIAHRTILLKPQPYFALILSLFIFSPVIYWNWSNDWVSLRHTAGHANIEEGFKISLSSFFEFIGSQIGVLTPILFIMLVMAFVKLKDRPFIFSFSMPVLCFFVLKSLQGKVQANWAMPGYISALIGLSIHWYKGLTVSKRESRILLSTFLIALLINLVGLYPHFFHIPVKFDPSHRLRGWSNLAGDVDIIRQGLLKRDEPLIIFSDSYQVASEMAFYLKDNPKTYSINLTGRRMNQYDLWQNPMDELERLRNQYGKINGIFVGSTRLDYSSEFAHRCDRIEKKMLDLSHKNRVINSHFLLICYNLTSLPHRRAVSY